MEYVDLKNSKLNLITGNYNREVKVYGECNVILFLFLI